MDLLERGATHGTVKAAPVCFEVPDMINYSSLPHPNKTKKLEPTPKAHNPFTKTLIASGSTVAPRLFYYEIASFKTSSRSYIPDYGVRRHPDVIDR